MTGRGTSAIIMEEGGIAMKRISAWFDAHPKTRIALQLVLDGLPFLLLAFPFTVGIIEVNAPGVNIPYWVDSLAIFSMQCVMYGGAALLYIIDLGLSSYSKRAMEQYLWCRTLSGALRVLSCVPAVLSAGLCIGLLFYYFKNR